MIQPQFALHNLRGRLREWNVQEWNVWNESKTKTKTSWIEIHISGHQAFHELK